MIDHAPVMRRRDDRRTPAVAVLQLIARHREAILGVRHDRAAVLGARVEFLDDPLVAAGVDLDRVLRVKGRDRALAAADAFPVLVADPAAVRAAGDADGRVVLLAAVDAVREQVVRVDAVELRSRLVVLRRPALATIQRNRGAPIVAVDQVLVVLRVDPERMVIAVRRGDHGERLAAVGAAKGRRVQHVHGRFILRVGEEMDVVPGASAQLALVVGPRPRRTGVVGAEQTPVVGLDHRPDALGVCRGHRDRRLPHHLRQPLRQARPGLAGVGRLPDAGTRTAGAYAPREPLVVPHRGVQHARVGDIDAQLARPGQRVDEEHLLP